MIPDVRQGRDRIALFPRDLQVIRCWVASPTLPHFETVLDFKETVLHSIRASGQGVLAPSV